MTDERTSLADESLSLHRQWRGKLAVAPKCPLDGALQAHSR